jgi:intracellular sulfur oxidation DsrE/DsrF family protein
MKNLRFNFLILTLLLLSASAVAQEVVDYDEHKIVIQLTSDDTLVHKGLVKQIQNVLIATPNSKIEVVCHNNGIAFLQTAVTQQAVKIKGLKSKGVEFLACENTMRERKLKREELLPECGTVPSGVVEVVKKQEKGWAYIKAGL